jgi:hypothetical protein
MMKLDLKCLGEEPSDDELIKDEKERTRKLKICQKRKLHKSKKRRKPRIKG